MRRIIVSVFLACATHAFTGSLLRAEDEPTADDRVPDFKLSSKDFHAEFKKSEKAFALKYAGKTVELTGVVVGAGSGEVKPFPRVSYLALEGGVAKKGDLILPDVGCAMRNELPVPWKRAKPGQTARIIGGIPLVAAVPGLQDCVILEVKGDGPTTVTAEALAEEHRKNRAATNKKYKNRWLVIEGTIAEITKNESFVEVRLQTKKGHPSVACDSSILTKDESEALKAGQSFRMIAQYPDTNPAGQIILVAGLLVD